MTPSGVILNEYGPVAENLYRKNKNSTKISCPERVSAAGEAATELLRALLRGPCGWRGCFGAAESSSERL